MTQEEKAIAYDKVINKIKPLYEQARKNGNPIWSTYEYLIPELAESEDEKFRRYILNCCEVTIEEGDRGLELSMSTTKKLKAWLEKHKESKDFLIKPIYSSWDYMTKKEILYQILDYMRWIKKISDKECEDLKEYIKSKEQNDGVLTQIKNMEPISSDITLEKIEKATDELVQEIEKEQLEQKFANNKSEQQDWNEEDERMLSRCIKSIEMSKSFADSETFKSAKDNEISWLNNLLADCKRRKAYIAKLCSNEWSEEDRHAIENCEYAIKETFKDKQNPHRIGTLDWLKSRCPSWKPTDEQMGVLTETIDSVSDTYEPRCTLVSLYNDLKKLKEE